MPCCSCFVCKYVCLNAAPFFGGRVTEVGSTKRSPLSQVSLFILRLPSASRRWIKFDAFSEVRKLEERNAVRLASGESEAISNVVYLFHPFCHTSSRCLFICHSDWWTVGLWPRSCGPSTKQRPNRPWQPVLRSQRRRLASQSKLDGKHPVGKSLSVKPTYFFGGMTCMIRLK